MQQEQNLTIPSHAFHPNISIIVHTFSQSTQLSIRPSSQNDSREPTVPKAFAILREDGCKCASACRFLSFFPTTGSEILGGREASLHTVGKGKSRRTFRSGRSEPAILGGRVSPRTASFRVDFVATGRPRSARVLFARVAWYTHDRVVSRRLALCTSASGGKMRSPSVPVCFVHVLLCALGE